MKIESFTDLNAWKEAHNLVLLVYELTEKFPTTEKFGLTNQIRRAAVSITSNIAEGFSRRSSKEKIQFYRMALRSLTEAQNQIIIAKDLQYISNKEFEELFNKSIIVSKLVNGLIKSASNHP